MARELQLKTVPVDGISSDSEMPLMSYAEMLLAIMRNPPAGGGGLSLDEIVAALPMIDAVEKARDTGQETVVISDQQWNLLLEKLTQFRFSIVHRTIAEFGEMIRKAPEMGTNMPAELKQRSA